MHGNKIGNKNNIDMFKYIKHKKCFSGAGLGLNLNIMAILVLIGSGILSIEMGIIGEKAIGVYSGIFVVTGLSQFIGTISIIGAGIISVEMVVIGGGDVYFGNIAVEFVGTTVNRWPFNTIIKEGAWKAGITVLAGMAILMISTCLDKGVSLSPEEGIVPFISIIKGMVPS